MKRKQNGIRSTWKTITTTVWFLDIPAEVIIILNGKQQKSVHTRAHTPKIIKSSSYIVCVSVYISNIYMCNFRWIVSPIYIYIICDIYVYVWPRSK